MPDSDQATRPEVLRVHEQYFLMVYTWLMVSLLVEGAARLSGLPPWCDFTAVGVALVAAFMIPCLSRRMLRRRLTDSSCYLCIACRHYLDPQFERGICPECGRPYELEATRQLWINTFVIEKPQDPPSTKPKRRTHGFR